MYDSIATLKKEISRTTDEYLNEITEYSEREVYVYPRGVYNAEFYRAAQVGLHPSITLDLTNREDYEGENIVEFEGKTYRVIRVDWNAQRDKLSLILEDAIHVTGAQDGENS